MATHLDHQVVGLHIQQGQEQEDPQRPVAARQAPPMLAHVDQRAGCGHQHVVEEALQPGAAAEFAVSSQSGCCAYGSPHFPLLPHELPHLCRGHIKAPPPQHARAHACGVMVQVNG
jgi:hypothetical protein